MPQQENIYPQGVRRLNIPRTPTRRLRYVAGHPSFPNQPQIKVKLGKHHQFDKSKRKSRRISGLIPIVKDRLKADNKRKSRKPLSARERFRKARERSITDPTFARDGQGMIQLTERAILKRKKIKDDEIDELFDFQPVTQAQPQQYVFSNGTFQRVLS
ncbi:MAG: hypothetical protein CMJ25_03675 [Phycisphaerae bacterium]|nr:hypothetical protein [Phycisphaerae bacterium]|tara:strand:- start:5095 stop:5568 length:474 start_codon:yes stop_codon:yes gene_type:complete